MDGAAAFVAAFPGLIAVAVGAARLVRSRELRRHAGGIRIALIALTFLAIGACHSIDRDAFAHAPIAEASLPVREPLGYTIGANAGQALVLQNGLLGSYYAGAQFDRLDHQQIDPNVEFFWDATGNPVITAPDGIDTNEGDFRLPDTWGIWSVVWEGYLEVPSTDTYGLRIHVNNGGWLQLKDNTGALTVVIDCSGGTSFEGDCDATATLPKGRNYIRLSYFNNAPPSADAVLSWQPPGATGFTVVPTSSLFTQISSSNTTPMVDVGIDTSLYRDVQLSKIGVFTDPDGGPWIVTADFGDGTPLTHVDYRRPAGGATYEFTLAHAYDKTGTFTMTITVSDSLGATGSAAVHVLVRKIPVLFVPGIFGSELAATSAGFSDPIPDGHGGTNRIFYPGVPPCDNPVWFNICQAELTANDDYFDLLKFNPAGKPYVPAIQPNGHLVTLPQTPYSTTQQFFVAQGYVEGSDFFVFNYDWRQGVETTAHGLDAQVQQILRSSGAPKVDIIAHSLGGLVVRSFLVDGTQRTSAARVVILGAPELGTPLFGYALIGGTCLPPLSEGVRCLITQEEVADVSRAIPSALEIAPSLEYYRVFPNAIGDDHPSAYVDGRLSLPGQGPDGRWEALVAREVEVGVPTLFLTAGVSFHADDRFWLDRIPATTRLYLVAGTGQPTIGQVIERWARTLVPRRDVNGLIIGQTVQLTKRLETRLVDGDTRVVTQSAALNESATPPSNVSVVYVSTAHEFLTDQSVLPVSITLLQGDDAVARYPGFVARGPVQPSGVVISGHSPIELVVRDAAGRRIGSADGRHGFGELPQATYDKLGDAKFITLTTPQAVTTNLYGSADGDGLVRVRRMQNGVIVGQSVFTHVPTRPGSLASFAVDASGIAGTMQVDLNGDGATDVVLTPTELSAAAADDLAPPTIRITSPDGRAVVGGVPLAWVSTDDLSGVASSGASLDGDLQTSVANGTSVSIVVGRHSVDVIAEDRAGNFATASRSFMADAYAWLDPLDGSDAFAANAGRTIPVKFTVTASDGTVVADDSVTVTLIDRAGKPVVGPLVAGPDPASGVKIGPDYHADMRTTGLTPGTYRIRVNFNSASLVGEFSREISLR